MSTFIRTEIDPFCIKLKTTNYEDIPKYTDILSIQYI